MSPQYATVTRAHGRLQQSHEIVQVEVAFSVSSNFETRSSQMSPDLIRSSKSLSGIWKYVEVFGPMEMAFCGEVPVCTGAGTSSRASHCALAGLESTAP